MEEKEVGRGLSPQDGGNLNTGAEKQQKKKKRKKKKKEKKKKKKKKKKRKKRKKKKKKKKRVAEGLGEQVLAPRGTGHPTTSGHPLPFQRSGLNWTKH